VRAQVWTRFSRGIPLGVAAASLLAWTAACGPHELLGDGETGDGGDDGPPARTGDLLWERSIDFGAVDAAQTVAIAADGSVVVGGGITAGATGQDAWVAALDPDDGSTRWTWTYNGPGDGNDVVLGLAASPNGDLIAVGNVTDDAGDDGRNFLVVRLDASGQTRWIRRTSSGVGADTLNDVIEHEEYLVVAGRFVDAITDETHGWLEWIDPDDGTSLGSLEMDESSYWIDIARDDPGFVVVGRRTTPAGQTAIWAFGRGVLELDAPFESEVGKGVETLNGVAEDSEGAFAVTGVSPRLEAPDAIFVGTLRRDGSIDQGFAFDGREPEVGDVGFDVAVDPWGDVVVVGKQSETGGDRAIVSKRTPGEAPTWTKHNTASEGAGAAAVAIDADGGIYVVGSTVDGDSGGGLNVWVAKYAP